jgi:hypothetical protein
MTLAKEYNGYVNQMNIYTDDFTLLLDNIIEHLKLCRHVNDVELKNLLGPNYNIKYYRQEEFFTKLFRMRVKTLDKVVLDLNDFRVHLFDEKGGSPKKSAAKKPKNVSNPAPSKTTPKPKKKETPKKKKKA